MFATTLAGPLMEGAVGNRENPRMSGDYPNADQDEIERDGVHEGHVGRATDVAMGVAGDVQATPTTTPTVGGNEAQVSSEPRPMDEGDTSQAMEEERSWVEVQRKKKSARNEGKVRPLYHRH